MRRSFLVEERLRAIFERAILVALAGAAGCNSDKSTGAASDAGATDGPVTVTDAGKDAGNPDDPCSASVYTPTPPDTCGDYVKFPCGLPAGIVPRDDCFFNLADCADICPDLHYNCHAADGYCADAGADGGVVVADDAGAVAIDCAICPNGVGRIPAGLVALPRGDVAASEATRERALGDWFARAAHLEAASVIAFRRLAADLARLGAPASLVEGAEDAARDEIRHTRTTARLARRFGGRYTRPRVDGVAFDRSLEAIATENAVEGCVRETFGALVATWQAERAADPAIRAASITIADDETRHAALSWSILAWSSAALDAAARARIAEQCERTIAELSRALPPSGELARAAGLPTADEHRALARAFAAGVLPLAA